MIFINYKKINIFKQILEKFSDENRMMCFGVVKSFVAGRYKWVATYLFKNRNNTSTNKHRAFVSFYSDVEMNKNEFGNVPELQSNPVLERIERPKQSKFDHELSSKQYKTLGQEYVEFDSIDYIDASGVLSSNPLTTPMGHEDVFHVYGDAPVFVAAGYRIVTFSPLNPTEYIVVYTYENPPVEINLKYNNIEIVMNDDTKDLYSNEYFLSYIDGAEPLGAG